MMRWSPDQRATLDSIVDEFVQQYPRGRRLLAVDGIDGAGTTPFADLLAGRFDRKGQAVARASIDGFHHSREERDARGRDSAEGHYHDSYDYDIFHRYLVEPFKLIGSAGFVTAVFDYLADAPLELRWETTQPDSTLIVDGVFLNRPELRELWNYSIWLDVPSDVAEARVLERDGIAGQERNRGGQALYLADADPRAAATAIIDNADVASPKRMVANAGQPANTAPASTAAASTAPAPHSTRPHRSVSRPAKPPSAVS